MRLARSRCGSSPVMAVVLAVMIGLCFSSVVCLVGPTPAAEAAVAPLAVGVDRQLTLTGEAVKVTVGGRMGGSLEGDRLVISLRGPAQSSQVGQSSPELPEVDKIVVELGEAAASTTTTTIETARLGSLADIRAGILKVEVSVSGALPAEPGAYLLVAELKSAGVLTASGQVWIGKAAPRTTPLDLAFVWPVSLGIHRDAEGVFFDQVLEQAVAAGDAGDLRGLLTLTGRFPNWDFTLAVEPVLLTQMRDMADGYARVDASGARVEVPPDDPVAVGAAEILVAFRDLAHDGSVEMAVGPYSGADLGVLAAEGWRDGLQQIQMGKQEVQQTLGLATPPKGGYSPDLDLTSEGLSYYAGASIDSVVVGQALAELLTEPVAAGAVAVRARNAVNDRVTLVFASSGLSAHMTAPWDAGVFAAALAAELAAGAGDAIVVAPRVEFALVPAVYLESLGRVLQSTNWVRTRTLTALLRAHGPDTRPILLKTNPGSPAGYIESSLLDGLKAAHAVVSDLSAVADATRDPVEEAHRLLFVAESRWWSRPDTSPQEASVGMQYAEKARLLAQGELAKIRFEDAGSDAIVGDEGTVGLVVQNDADYPLTVALALDGSGVILPQGGRLEVELVPGRTEVPIQVEGEESPYELRATLLAGDSALDEIALPLRFITVTTLLPWVIAGALIVGAAAVFLARRSLRKRRGARVA